MRVKIGPYLNWWGPYQIVDLLFRTGGKSLLDESELTWRHRAAERIGDWLADTRFAKLCEWVHSKRKRTVRVHIDNYDVWNMDETLRLIIAPMLVKLKACKHGSGFVDDEDVPLHLRSTAAPATENAWDTDSNFHLRYEWLLGELIWVFATDHDAVQEQFYDHSAVKDCDDLSTQLKRMRIDQEGLNTYRARVRNAYRLFGKYYETLWD